MSYIVAIPLGCLVTYYRETLGISFPIAMLLAFIIGFVSALISPRR